MCLKTIYHNYYAGGHTDVTERVETCTPGYVCANPRVRELDRHFPYAKLARQSTFTHSPATYNVEERHIRPPSPLTPPGSRGSSGGGSGHNSDGSEGRRRSSKIYYDGTKFVRASSHRSRPTVLVAVEPSPRPTFVPSAPEPPRPIPIKRSSTMPSSQWGLETPPPELPSRSRRPIIIEDRLPPSPRMRPSRSGPAPDVEVLEHATAGRRRSSRIEPADLLSPHYQHHHRRHHSGSPQGYGSAEDESERRKRRRQRREANAQAAAMATSVPTFGNTDIFGTSFDSSAPSSPRSSGASSPVVGSSPAVAAVKKLRWEDEMRAEQNARISQRPKLSRSATSALQGQVKSILKNGGGSPGSSPVVQPRADDDDDKMAELYRSVQGLNLDEDTAERRARIAEDKDSAAYIDRLRSRFTMPPRRYTAGTGTRRRTEIFYPDEGRFKYV